MGTQFEDIVIVVGNKIIDLQKKDMSHNVKTVNLNKCNIFCELKY